MDCVVCTTLFTTQVTEKIWHLLFQYWLSLMYSHATFMRGKNSLKQVVLNTNWIGQLNLCYKSICIKTPSLMDQFLCCKEWSLYRVLAVSQKGWIAQYGCFFEILAIGPYKTSWMLFYKFVVSRTQGQVLQCGLEVHMIIWYVTFCTVPGVGNIQQRMEGQPSLDMTVVISRRIMCSNDLWAVNKEISTGIQYFLCSLAVWMSCALSWTFCSME